VEALEKERAESEKGRREMMTRLRGAQQELLLETERREEVERELSSTRGAEDELHRQWGELNHSYATLQAEMEGVRVELEAVRRAKEEHEQQLEVAKTAREELVKQLAAAQESEREAVGTALVEKKAAEREVEELKKLLASREGEIELHLGRVKTLEEVRDGLREQVTRWETVAAEKDEKLSQAEKEVEEVKREKERAVVEGQKQLRGMEKTAREAVNLAGRMKDENEKITEILNAPPPPSSSSKAGGDLDKATSPSLSLADATFSSLSLFAAPPSASTPPPTLPPLDYSSAPLPDLLAALSAYNHDALTDAVKNKVDSLNAVTRKWVKEAKAYRERAHRAAGSTNDKIAFRKCVVSSPFPSLLSFHPTLLSRLLSLVLTLQGVAQLHQRRPRTLPPYPQLGGARLGGVQRLLPSSLPERDGSDRGADEDEGVDRCEDYVVE
jgi:autophagy-related protein 11